MTLQFQLDNLDGLDESISKLYSEKDGKFVLDVTGHEKTEDGDTIPKSRLDQEITKRKDAEKELSTIAEDLKKDVPEDMQDLVPDLPSSKLIKWLRSASAKGLFDSKTKESIDSRRPGDKPGSSDNLSPQARMSTGYKTK